MKKSANINDYNKISPSGICRMGEIDVTYYRLGNRLWFDKLAVEKVLTGKNQHNLLGQYKDPKNHSNLFDLERKEVVAIISKTGIHNYLKKAWSVKEENRHYFYAGLKTIEKPGETKETEPLQMPIFNSSVPMKVNPFIKITDMDGQYSIDYTIDGKNGEEKMQNLARMLISAANAVMTNSKVKLKEVA